MAKQIRLSKNKFALVDDEDFEYLNQWKWIAHNDRKRWYARRKENGKHIAMHRVIMGVDNPKIEVDHRSGDGLDNRRKNLRKCTRAQNQINRGKQSNNTVGFKGVSLDKRGKYKASIRVNGELIFLGYFDNPVGAATAYDWAAKEHFGEFAYLNFHK